MLDYETFKARVLTSRDYLEDCEYWESWSDSGGPEGSYPSYSLLYVKMREICVEQWQIVQMGRDFALLSLTLENLPRLAEFSLKFCETLETEDWVESVVWRMTMKERPYEHHIRQVSTAMTASVRTIQLIGLSLCHSGPRRVRDMHYLTTSLAGLLRFARRLRLLWSESALESLAEITLDIHELDLCSISIAQEFLTAFLRTNARSIHRLGLHNVEVSNGRCKPNISLCPQSIGETLDVSFQGNSKLSYECCQCPW
jgi:hypothetical protein